MPAKKSKPAKSGASKKPVKVVKKPAPAAKTVKSKAKPIPASKTKSATSAKTKKAVAKPVVAKKKSPPVTPKTAKPVASKKSAPSKSASAKAEKPKAAPAKKAEPTKAARPVKAVAPALAKVEKATKPAVVPAPPVAEKAAPKKSSSSGSRPSTTNPTKLTFAPLKPTPRHQPEEVGATIEAAKGPVKMTPFLKRQKQRLIELRDTMLNLIEGVARDSLRQRAEGGEASAFGMHQADAGSDAYDRDFALSLLSQEQDALNEINEAMTRMESGTYGICEMSGKKIPEIRLEALPFTRYTVECQEQIERRQMGGRGRVPVRSLFGLDEASDESGDDGDEEESSSSSRNNNSESLDFAKD